MGETESRGLVPLPGEELVLENESLSDSSPYPPEKAASSCV